MSAIPRNLVIDKDGKLTYPVQERSNETILTNIGGQTCSSSSCCIDCCSHTQLQTKSPFYSKWPNTAVGKVYFNLGAGLYVCSASVGGDNLVWTAGHCVYDNQNHIWASNWMFVPGYMNGRAPLGVWVASNLFTTGQWVNGNILYDYALTVMTPINGISIAEVVGGALGLNYNIASTSRSHYNSYGYPQGSPFNGAWINVCKRAPGCLRDGSESNSPVAIGCDSTGGCSGGPWITSESPTSISGLNSYTYLSLNNMMFSPYFDKNTRVFFDFVSDNTNSNTNKSIST